MFKDNRSSVFFWLKQMWTRRCSDVSEARWVGEDDAWDGAKGGSSAFNPTGGDTCQMMSTSVKLFVQQVEPFRPVADLEVAEGAGEVSMETWSECILFLEVQAARGRDRNGRFLTGFSSTRRSVRGCQTCPRQLLPPEQGLRASLDVVPVFVCSSWPNILRKCEASSTLNHTNRVVKKGRVSLQCESRCVGHVEAWAHGTGGVPSPESRLHVMTGGFKGGDWSRVGALGQRRAWPPRPPNEAAWQDVAQPSLKTHSKHESTPSVCLRGRWCRTLEARDTWRTWVGRVWVEDGVRFPPSDFQGTGPPLWRSTFAVLVSYKSTRTWDSKTTNSRSVLEREPQVAGGEHLVFSAVVVAEVRVWHVGVSVATAGHTTSGGIHSDSS